MRKQIEDYLSECGWKATTTGWTSPTYAHHVMIVAGHWQLSTPRPWSPPIDDGESLGELKLALAGLEAQATQGAI